jgi:hypothetical protein
MQLKLPSFVRLSATLLLAISTAGAAPATPIIKNIYETQALTASGVERGDGFGCAVSILGNLAIVGARFDSDKGPSSGSAYIFAFDGTSWNQQAKLTSSDEVAFDQFGSAVAISGNTALIGAPDDKTLADYAGAVYVFTFDGTAWTQQAKLFASDGELEPGSTFGRCIALSGDIAVIGSDAEAAYVFTFDGTVWSEQAKLTASDGFDHDHFGTAVALSGTSHGTGHQQALVGAYENGLGGAAYIFDFDGASWNQEAKLTALDTADGDDFGWTVWLSGDLALVGAPSKAGLRGAAYFFAFDGTTWSQETKLKAPGAKKNSNFGYSVLFSDTVALVGSDVIFGEPGVIYEYVLHQNAWTPRAQLRASRGLEGGGLGSCVALSGNTILAGADNSDGGPGTNQAFIFSLDQ